MIAVELNKMIRSRRMWITIALIDALPTPVAVLLSRTNLGPRPGTGPAFLSAVLSDGTLFPLAAIAIILPLFLPAAVAVFAGEAIAGEAQAGTMRYVLVRAVGRTRLLVAKLVSVIAFVLLTVLVVAVTAYITGSLLLGNQHLASSVSGSSLSSNEVARFGRPGRRPVCGRRWRREWPPRRRQPRDRERRRRIGVGQGTSRRARGYPLSVYQRASRNRHPRDCRINCAHCVDAPQDWRIW
ncbi:MAG: ABC transporter permease [Sporichthyaceae bacterium]